MRQGKQQAGAAINPGYGLTSDPAAADVVRRIYQEFTEPFQTACGLRRPALAEIAAGLNLDGIPTVRGGQWHASGVRYILRNGAYVHLVGEEVFAAAQDRLGRLRRGPTA